MDYKIVQFTSIEIDQKAKFINDYSKRLADFYEDKYYGEGIIEMVVGIICVSKNFEQFFVPKKPKYIDNKKTIKSIYTKQTHEIERCLVYDIKIDFEIFTSAENENEREKIISNAILDSLIVFDQMKKKYKTLIQSNLKMIQKPFLKRETYYKLKA